MENLDNIHKYINDSTMILVINNNSKSLLESLFNLLYNKYSSTKLKCTTTKGLMSKLSKIKNKLIRHETDLSKIQFSSSKNNSKLREDFGNLSLFLTENNSKILLKFDISSYVFDYEDTFRPYDLLRKIVPQYNLFNLVILIDKNDVKILQYITENESFNMFDQYGNKEKHKFDITTLIRSTKLKKIRRLYDTE